MTISNILNHTFENFRYEFDDTISYIDPEVEEKCEEECLNYDTENDALNVFEKEIKSGDSLFWNRGRIELTSICIFIGICAAFIIYCTILICCCRK